MERPSIKKRILVTGGAGFIGSHVVEKLCDKGHYVRVIDNLSFGFKNFVDKRADFIQGSIGDKSVVEKALEEIDIVIHLAASSIIKFSFDRPQEYFQNNVLNGIVLLEAMRKKNVKKIINSSTAAVYGEPKRIPIQEDDRKNPMNPYGSSKLAFEETLRFYYNAFGINSVSLRYFNAYGPRDEQQPSTRAIPLWMKAVIRNEAISLYWEGNQLRDYVYVEDIAQAHVDVLNLSGLHFYNIGCGKGILMKDMLKEFETIVGKKIKIKELGERKGDPHALVASIKKIKQDIGWEPKISLKEGLKKTYDYYASVY